MKTRIALVLLAATLALSASASQPDMRDGFAQIDTFALEDFSWVKKQIVKAPAFKSEKVRYTAWVLGDGKDSTMLMCWDESQGTGKGYDTVYLDRNFNGDLTDADECHAGAKPGPDNVIEVKGIKDAKGERTFNFKFVIKKNQYDWQSGFSMSGAGRGYSVGLLPGNLQVRWSEDLKTAPVYRFGGPAIPSMNGKFPGEALGKWSAGSLAGANITCNLFGDETASRLMFYHSNVPGGSPQISLRVLGADGAPVEDIPFSGGCGCAGSFGQSLLIPSRVPDGKHNVVVRLKRADYVGGPADFLFPVEIENPDFGKPLQDAAFQALKAKFPSAKFVSLRRAANAQQAAKGFPEENVVGVRTADNTLYGNTRDWGMTNVNMGAEPFEGLGTQIHHHDASRSLISFDLTTLPKDAKIAGAQLRLTLSQQPFTGCKDAKIEAFAVKQEWNEVNAEGGHSCWLGPKYIHNNPKAVRWGTPGCENTETDRFAEAAGTADVGTFPANKTERYRFIGIDITETVKSWQSGKSANHGLLLKFSGGGCLKYCSSDFQDYPFRPTLVIAYEGGAVSQAFTTDAEEDFAGAIEKAKKSGKPLLVKLYSPRCLVCRKAKETTFANPTVKQALASYEAVSMKIEEHAKSAQEWGVTAVPAVVILKPDGSAQRVIESDDIVDARKFVQVLEGLAQK
jgi:hypothetical protein